MSASGCLISILFCSVDTVASVSQLVKCGMVGCEMRAKLRSSSLFPGAKETKSLCMCTLRITNKYCIILIAECVNKLKYRESSKEMEILSLNYRTMKLTIHIDIESLISSELLWISSGYSLEWRYKFPISFSKL